MTKAEGSRCVACWVYASPRRSAGSMQGVNYSSPGCSLKAVMGVGRWASELCQAAAGQFHLPTPDGQNPEMFLTYSDNYLSDSLMYLTNVHAVARTVSCPFS